MEIKTIIYNKTFNLGNYSNEKIGVEVSLGEGEDPVLAFGEAKKLVEKSHKFFQDLPAYERARHIVKNTDDVLGRDVKAAKEVIKAFEENYPDYIRGFQVPVTRQLEQGVVDDDDDFRP